MAVSYRLIPKDMFEDLMRQNAPQDLDENIIKKSVDNMSAIKRSQILNMPEKIQHYRANLRNVIKTKRDVESRPLKVNVENIKSLAEHNIGHPPSGKKIGKNLGRQRFSSSRTANLLGDYVKDEEMDENDYESVSSGTLNRTIQPEDVFMGDTDNEEENEENFNVYGHQRVRMPTPAPKKRLYTPDTPESNERGYPTRKMRKAHGPPMTDEEKKSELIEAIRLLINSNVKKFGVQGDKILDKNGELIRTSNVEKALDYIVSNALGLPIAGNKGPGVEQLFKRLAADQRYRNIVESIQEGRGFIKHNGKSNKNPFHPSLKNWVPITREESSESDNQNEKALEKLSKLRPGKKKRVFKVKKEREIRRTMTPKARIVQAVYNERKRNGKKQYFVKIKGVGKPRWVSYEEIV